MADKELSDFSITRTECKKCGATWINGKHVWRGTGNEGSELDLAGLVCNKYSDSDCINPSKGLDGGDTWAYRAGFIDGAMTEKKKSMEQLRDFGNDLDL
jgi:hypothetical protein